MWQLMGSVCSPSRGGYNFLTVRLDNLKTAALSPTKEYVGLASHYSLNEHQLRNKKKKKFELIYRRRLQLNENG